MPTAPARPCRGRCRPCALTTHPSGYCETCRPVAARLADSEPTRKASHAFLTRAPWRKLRKRILARDPVCRKCGRELSTVGAHLVPRDRCEAVSAAMLALPAEANDGQAIAAINRALGDGWRAVYVEMEFAPGRAGYLQFDAREGREWRHLFFRPLALIREGWDLRLDDANVQGWCAGCHNPESGAMGAAKVNAERTRR